MSAGEESAEFQYGAGVQPDYSGAPRAAKLPKRRKKPKGQLANTHDRDLTDAGRIMKQELLDPKKLDEVLVETLGGEKLPVVSDAEQESELSVEGLFQQQIHALAEELIHAMDPSVTFRLDQWQHIQALTENALITGWNRGRASR